MIYFTGDTHGGIDMKKISNRHWKEGKDLTEKDFLVILGDFGFPFLDEDRDPKSKFYGEYRYWMKWMAEKPYTVLWVDGNHDNHPFWAKQPVETRWGGRVQPHPDAPNVFHLMRGEYYEIDGHTFFAFGGAASTDRGFRSHGYDWWCEEEAGKAEIEHARETLAAHGHRVDCILTHTIPATVFSHHPEMRQVPCRTSAFLTEVMETTDYKVWCSGHLHKEWYSPHFKMRGFYNTVRSWDELFTEEGFCV